MSTGSITAANPNAPNLGGFRTVGLRELALLEISGPYRKLCAANGGCHSPQRITTLEQFAAVEIVKVRKLVVASLKANGEEVYRRSWNHDYMDLPIVDAEDQNSEAFTPEQMTQILDAAFETAVKKPKSVVYWLSLIVGGLGLRIGEALAIKARDNIGCPHCKALKPRKCRHGSTFSEDCRVLHVWQSVWGKKLKAPKTKNGMRDVDVPESLAVVLCNLVAGKKAGTCCSNHAMAVRYNSAISTAIGFTPFLKRWGCGRLNAGAKRTAGAR